MKYKKPDECWYATPENKHVFIKERKCNRIDYHGARGECAPFDKLIASFCQDAAYTTTFFSYYKTTKTVPFAPFRNAFGAEIERISCYNINLLEPWEIIKKYGAMPEICKKWPGVIRVSGFAPTRRAQTNLLKSVAKCIEKRRQYRTRCIISCSKDIKGLGSHDRFLELMQILRAKLIMSLK